LSSNPSPLPEFSITGKNTGKTGKHGDARTNKDWSLTSLKDKLIKIGAKVVNHGCYAAFQMAEVAIPRQIFQ
jgi:hypothetical protein